jgi:hypothetical protein
MRIESSCDLRKLSIVSAIGKVEVACVSVEGKEYTQGIKVNMKMIFSSSGCETLV